MRLLPIAAALFASLAGAAQADTFTTPLVTQQSEGSFLDLQQFNPTLGQLTQVTLHLTGTVTSSFTAEATSTRPGAYTFAFNLDTAFTVNLPTAAQAAPLVLAAKSTTTRSVGAFDGTLDFGGTSGVTLLGVQATASAERSFDTPLLLNLFTGTGTVTLDTLAQNQHSIQGVARYRGGFEPTALVSATVTYTYDARRFEPTPIDLVYPPVPEPGTWALLLVGLAAIGWKSARRSS